MDKILSNQDLVCTMKLMNAPEKSAQYYNTTALQKNIYLYDDALDMTYS